MKYPVLLPAINWLTEQNEQQRYVSNLYNQKYQHVTVLIVDIRSLDWKMIRRAYKTLHHEWARCSETVVGLGVELRGASFFAFDVDVLDVQQAVGLGSKITFEVADSDNPEMKKTLLKRDAYGLDASGFTALLRRFEDSQPYEMENLQAQFSKYTFQFVATTKHKPMRGSVHAPLHMFGPSMKNPVAEYFFASQK